MSDRITTIDQAEKLSPYELARRWSDRTQWPVPMPRTRAEAAGIPVREVADDLEELAVMAALRSWLDRWTPISIHRALLAGASVEDVAAAAGHDPFAMFARWREWSDGQRQLWLTYPDMDRSEEHDRVAAELARAESAPNGPSRHSQPSASTPSPPITFGERSPMPLGKPSRS